MIRRPVAHLVLSDGTIFEGEAAGAILAGGVATGEAVFNTSLSGYQEVITDPSYAGQVVTFTYPHVGSYGVTEADDESRGCFLSGVIVRDLPPLHSSWRAEGSLEAMLIDRGVPAITGIDTRRLTRHLRDHGALPCAFGTVEPTELVTLALQAQGTDGCGLALDVSIEEPYRVGTGELRVVALDLGIKRTILAYLGSFATVDVVPATTGAEELLAMEPDGIFLSNGPGDPAALGSVSATVAALVGKRPLLGICLGHQILATALGGETYKLPFGHHGSNHPVMQLATGHVEITAQNHNYAVLEGSVPGAQVTHVNLNDGVIEGLAVDSADAVSVQHHPEAGPGPHDSSYLFEDFARRIAVAREGRG
jgi:carbamoyl-phosphate synthase small subunit